MDTNQEAEKNHQDYFCDGDTLQGALHSYSSNCFSQQQKQKEKLQVGAAFEDYLISASWRSRKLQTFLFTKHY